MGRDLFYFGILNAVTNEQEFFCAFFFNVFSYISIWQWIFVIYLLLRSFLKIQKQAKQKHEVVVCRCCFVLNLILFVVCLQVCVVCLVKSCPQDHQLQTNPFPKAFFFKHRWRLGALDPLTSSVNHIGCCLWGPEGLMTPPGRWVTAWDYTHACLWHTQSHIHATDLYSFMEVFSFLLVLIFKCITLFPDVLCLLLFSSFFAA